MLRMQLVLAVWMLFIHGASASAEQTKQEQPKQVTIVPSSTERPAVNELNLTLDASKQHFCFWGSAAYSPGSMVNFTDVSKNSTTCFHCNADGTWDRPCQ